MGQAARLSKMNSELLREVYLTVLLQDSPDRAEFGSLVDTLNQGASFEGVYNGFTHSARYREYEMRKKGASAAALRVFSEELAILELELPEPTQFDETSAQPLRRPDFPTGEERPSFDAPMRAAPSPKAPDPKALAELYARQFVGASIFTLKRVIGDEVFKVMATKREYREKLALWYARWVVRVANERRVDYGLPLRNLADEKFHYKWALDASVDRIQWEILNRLHRILNQANSDA